MPQVNVLTCVCSVRSLGNTIKTTQTPSASLTTSHCILSSCSTFGALSSCRSLTTVLMKPPITGKSWDLLLLVCQETLWLVFLKILYNRSVRRPYVTGQSSNLVFRDVSLPLLGGTFLFFKNDFLLLLFFLNRKIISGLRHCHNQESLKSFSKQ